MPDPLAESISRLQDVEPRSLDNRELGDMLRELARLRAQLDAVELRAILEFDQRRACTHDGMVSTKAWLAHHTGAARQVAGSRVNLAKKLRRLPLMVAALATGDVTEAHARSLCRTLTTRTYHSSARDEAMLVARAIELEADDFDIVISRWLYLADDDGPDPGCERPSELHVSPLLDGRLRVDGELDLDDGVDVRAELEALYDELWHQDQQADDSDPLKHRTSSQRYAAALVEMARRSSAVGDRDSDPDDGQPVTIRRRPRMKQILVVADVNALLGDRSALAALDDGTPIPQRVLQQWSCDSAIGRILMKGPSLPLDVGTITYTATDGQRRALIARDRGCIVPGCKRKPRWCEAHHVNPWPNGPTNMGNLVLLCHRHHKQVHAKIVGLEPAGTPGRWTVTRPDGSPLLERPPPALVA